MFHNWIMDSMLLKIRLAHLSELALGGTAVGTGINTPEIIRPMLPIILPH